MRLIDADKYSGKCISNRLYCGVDKLIEMDSVPTAFDLEKVIENLEEKLKYAEQKAAIFDEKENAAMMDMWDAIANSYRNSIKIVKDSIVEKY